LNICFNNQLFNNPSKIIFLIFKTGNWFITRPKENMDYEVIEIFDVSKEKDQNVRQGIDIRLSNLKGKEGYPKKLRLVRYWDEKNYGMSS